jgi:hypothetical protein
LDSPDIPKHILGFHFDFKLTKQRIDQYYDEKYESSGNCKWDKWEAFNDLEKEAYLQTIRMLKFQQSWLKEEEEESERMRARGATRVKRPNNRFTMNRSVIGLSRSKKRMAAGTATNTMNTTSAVSKKIKSFSNWTPAEDENSLKPSKPMNMTLVFHGGSSRYLCFKEIDLRLVVEIAGRSFKRPVKKSANTK